MLKKSYEQYAPAIVRWGIGLTFLWFGLNQLFLPDNFMGYLPDVLLSSNYALLFVRLNGVAELILSLMLLAGFLTRIVAGLLTLHLISITVTLGYNDIAIRDIGLAIVTFAIALGGADKWCLDKRKKETQ